MPPTPSTGSIHPHAARGRGVVESSTQARRLVWVLAGAGVLGGCVACAALALVLGHVRSQREGLAAERGSVQAMLTELHRVGLQAHREATAKLAYPPLDHPPDSPPWREAMRRLSRHRLDGAASHALRSAEDYVERLDNDATAWREETLRTRALWRSARDLIHHRLGSLRDALRHESDSLASGIASHLANSAGAAIDPAPLAAMRAERGRVLEAYIECLKLETVVTHVADAETTDTLAALLDNSLTPGLARLGAVLQQPDVMRGLEGALYGGPEGPGLVGATQLRLALRGGRDRLMAQLDDAFEGLRLAALRLEAHSNGRWQLASLSQEASLIRTWVALAILGLMGGVLFVTLARRVAVTLGDQIEAIEQASRSLAQAQKLESIGQLAAGIAHEINTPLQYISGNVEFLTKCCEGMFHVMDVYERLLHDMSEAKDWGDRIREAKETCEEARYHHIRKNFGPALDESRQGVERVLQIVRAMRQFSHPGSAQRAPIDLNAAVESTLTITRNRWKYHATAHKDLAPDLPELIGLPAEVNQLLLNLVVNAADAVAERVGDSGELGAITVRTRHEPGWLVVEVEDTGTGIPEAARSKVFDPFFTTKEVGKGTGQGLTLCHNVAVAMHGGQIDFTTATGVGTTFRVRFPAGGTPSPQGAPAVERPAELVA